MLTNLQLLPLPIAELMKARQEKKNGEAPPHGAGFWGTGMCQSGNNPFCLASHFNRQSIKLSPGCTFGETIFRGV